MTPMTSYRSSGDVKMSMLIPWQILQMKALLGQAILKCQRSHTTFIVHVITKSIGRVKVVSESQLDSEAQLSNHTNISP